MVSTEKSKDLYNVLGIVSTRNAPPVLNRVDFSYLETLLMLGSHNPTDVSSLLKMPCFALGLSLYKILATRLMEIG